MGFSNNKWKKILIILSIINLCFILFTRFSKVFAAYDYTYDGTDYTFPDDTWSGASSYSHQLIILRRVGSGTQNDPYDFEVGYYYSNYTFATTKSNNKINIIAPTNSDAVTKRSVYYYNTNTWAQSGSSVSKGYTIYFPNDSHFVAFLYSTDDIMYGDTVIVPATPTFVYPFFDNSTEIENGNPDGVYISVGDYSNTDNLYFHLLQIDTGLSNSDTSVYYYSDKTFTLNKDSEYYRTWYDPSIEGYYYFIPRYELGLSQNTSYLYVLNNSKNQIQNSYGIYSKDVTNGIYDVVQSDTAGVITATEEETDRMKNIEQTLINNQNSMDNIQNTLTDTNVTEDTQTDINSSLQFNNQNEGLTNLNNGFFSRLTTMLSNLLGYNLAQDTYVSFPLPNTNKTLVLHSVDIYNNVSGTLRLIINAFWIYIFSFYMWKFINKIYIAISSGTILDTFSSSGEAITNDML